MHDLLSYTIKQNIIFIAVRYKYDVLILDNLVSCMVVTTLTLLLLAVSFLNPR